MAEERFVFEEVTELNAVARGVPGQRTFYLVVGRGNRWVRMWLEKDQLQALGNAVDQLLAEVHGQETQEQPNTGLLSPLDPPEPPDGDFRAGRLALGHDAARDMLVLVMHRENLPEQRPPTVQFWATRPQMRALSQRIREVCAAGRPVCPLCGGPVDPEGHPCPKANGHRPVSLEQR